MHEYYFKIKKGDIEFECSTTDKVAFEEKLSDWINGLVQGKTIETPQTADTLEQNPVNDESSKTNSSTVNDNEQTETAQARSGFIDVKNLSSINDITAPTFEEEKPDIPTEMNFESALEESIQNPKTEVIEKEDAISDFSGYLKSYNSQSSVDSLIITAMYIINIENKERFTIKEINAKLVPLTESPIDHSVIEEAISQNYIKIIPDLTGTSEYTEYTLTEQGEGYFVE